ncbi:restriction endonuclease subunit S [Nostoc linckia FACHB-104]|nr:restriction endonuclease subunit S [Nostoc linckia FACHB-104]
MEDREDLAELPTGWILTKFEELSEAIPNALKAGPFGSALKKEFYVSQGYKIYGQEQVIREDPFYGDYYIDEERYEALKSCAVKPGDILISLVGTIGKVLVLPEGIEPGIINPRLVKLSLEKKIISTDYIKAYLESSVVRSYLSSLSHGGTMDILNLTILKTLPITLPPLNEQRRIVAKIEALSARSQRVKEALEDIPQLLDQFRQSVLAAAFRGDLTADWREQNADIEPAEVLLEKIRAERRRRWEEAELEKMKASGKTPKDDKWKGKYKDTNSRVARQQVTEIRASKYKFNHLPVSWSAVKLGQIAQLQTGYAFKSSWFVPNGIRLLRGTNIVPGKTRWDDVVYLSQEQAHEFAEYMLQEGDIIIAMDRPIISFGLKIARLSIDDVPSLLLQRVGRFKLEQRIDPNYLFYFLNSQFFLSHIQEQATGTQLPHISANDIESVVVPLPPFEEQRAIGNSIRKWLAKIDAIPSFINSTFSYLDQLDQSILAKAFRGELVPQDPNDEPASVLLERIRSERAKLQTKTSAGRTKKTQPQEEESVQLELGLE